MKDLLLKNLANLLKVKTIITLILISVYSFLAVKGVVEANAFSNTVLMVVAFYFGTQNKKEEDK